MSNVYVKLELLYTPVTATTKTMPEVQNRVIWVVRGLPVGHW